jgi:RimJ/RimL family protein N-acetyltransferase
MPHSSKKIELPLIGDSVILDALSEDDFPSLEGFFRRPQDLYYYVPTPVFPRTAAQLRKMMADWNDLRRNYTFAIRSEGRLVGLLHLDDVDAINGHAEFGIALTEPSARGHGLAAQAIGVMLRYVFLELGLERITARIIDGNEPSIKLFSGLGFVHEGALRHFVLRGGEYLDMHVYGLLRSEWHSFLPMSARSGHTPGNHLRSGD